MNLNKITLSRSKVIEPAQFKVMRDHVKKLINEAAQDPNQDLFDGAILISKLIIICIENLKKQGFHYVQGDHTEMGYLYDELSKELSIVFMKQNDIENGQVDSKNPKKIRKGDDTKHVRYNRTNNKRPRRGKRTDIVTEQPLDESRRNAEFIYPFLQPNLEVF